MSDFTIKDFSAGWIPCDDPIQGRRNGLLSMNNLELDSNGALALAGGTVVKQSGYPSNAHTIYSGLVNGARADYALLADGSIYRNGLSVGSGGDSTNGAFGTAFNFTLIASGTKRYKDDGVSLVNLGVGAASTALTLSYSAANSPYNTVGDVTAHYAVPAGYGTALVVGTYLQMTCNASGQFIVQTYGGSGDPHNLNQMTGVGGEVGYATDSDYIQIQGYTPIVTSRSFNIDILLVAGDNIGTVVSDYYTYQVGDLSQITYSSLTGVFTIRMRRRDFIRVGNGSQDWSTVYGFRLSYSGGAASEVVNILGNGASSPVMYMIGGTRTQNGSYQFVQVNVNNTGSYIAKSTYGPVSKVLELDMGQSLITPYVTGIDSQVNEIWIYRKGGDLNNYFRTKTFTKPGGGWGAVVAEYDTYSDADAIALNMRLNLNLVSIDAATVTDKIYDIIGPVNNRWYYFTTNFMYPSEPGNPDLVDSSIAVRITGSTSELFMWARQVSDTTIVVGTNLGMYSLSGTFSTFPDFTIDAYYRPIKCKFPAITCDAEVFSGSIYYLASDGWRLFSADGSNPSLISPNLDRLYRGETVGSYVGPTLKVTPRSVRFPIVIAKNKMYCFITGIATPRIEVYDFIRQYWRPVLYGLGDITAACATQDGQVLVFFADKKLREIDVQSSKLLDAATKQTVSIKTVVFDGGTPRQRKDSSTLKMRAYTTDNTTISVLADGSATINGAGTFLVNTLVTDQAFDISAVANLAIVKTYQVSINVSATDFLLDDINISYDLRPEQRNFVRVQSNNYGINARKRFYSIPFQIDTLGNNVVLTPYIDGVAQTTLTVSSTRKKSFDYQFPISAADIAKGFDFEYTFHSSGLFEFFGFGEPKNIEVFPEQRISLVIPVTNFGAVGRKRLRMWPFVIDTLGQNVTLTPIVDGVAGTPVIFNCNKKTVYLYETSDVIGTDFSGYFSGANPFEVWEVGTPLQIEKFPDPVEYFVVPVTNFGTAARKRLRQWPFVIDTLGSDVTFTPIVDGVSGTPTTFNCSKSTVYLYETTDVVGTDFSGIFSGTNPFELWDIGIPTQIEPYPSTTKYAILPVSNFGTANKKRVRVQPFVLSSPTAGNLVTFTPTVDGANTTPTIFTVNLEKKTYKHFYKTDIFGVDYSGILSSPHPFEVSAVLNPEIVQVLPIAKQFDQVGPEELFRYGKLKQIELRVLAYGTSIPYTIYFNDATSSQGAFTTVSGVEDSYYIMMPKGVAGRIVRIELGPTDFDFHRFYARLQVTKSGKDTELEWVSL